MARPRRARLASKYPKGSTAAQALGSFGFRIYDKRSCPVGIITFAHYGTGLVESISASIQIDI